MELFKLINLLIDNSGPSILTGTIGSHFVPHAKEFLVLAFQPILGRGHGVMCSFLQLLQADIGALFSRPKQVERLAKGREAI